MEEGFLLILKGGEILFLFTALDAAPTWYCATYQADKLAWLFKVVDQRFVQHMPVVIFLDDFSGRLPDVGGVGAEVMQQWYKACAGGAVHCRVMNLGHYRKTAFRKVANAV